MFINTFQNYWLQSLVYTFRKSITIHKKCNHLNKVNKFVEYSKDKYLMGNSRIFARHKIHPGKYSYKFAADSTGILVCTHI